MTRAYARHACPSLSAPMETGDGLLVRLVPAAPISLDAFVDLCTAARAHGNGTIEISARGSIQVRGLTPLSAPLFAISVAALDIELCGSVPVIADPLPGDPATLIDANLIVTALRSAIAESELRLAPKVSVIVDGGGSLDLDAIFADVRLRAVTTPGGPKFKLAIAGNDRSATLLATILPDKAVETVLNLLAQIAELGPEARGTDLLDRPAFPQPDHDSSPSSPRADPIGLHPVKDGGLALGVGLAFGHAEAEALSELGLSAKKNGAAWARPAPGRALLLGPLSEAMAMATREAAAGLGFATEADDPRRRIAACPGAPFCMHGLIAARALAAEITRQMQLPVVKGIALHVSGCAKGCAHPAAAPLTIVGSEKGCGIVRNGSARAMPTDYVDPGELIAALREASAEAREAVHA